MLRGKVGQVSHQGHIEGGIRIAKSNNTQRELLGNARVRELP